MYTLIIIILTRGLLHYYLAVDGWIGRPGFSLPLAVELVGTLTVLLALLYRHLGRLFHLGIFHLRNQKSNRDIWYIRKISRPQKE